MLCAKVHLLKSEPRCLLPIHPKGVPLFLFTHDSISRVLEPIIIENMQIADRNEHVKRNCKETSRRNINSLVSHGIRANFQNNISRACFKKGPTRSIWRGGRCDNLRKISSRMRVLQALWPKNLPNYEILKMEFEKSPF